MAAIMLPTTAAKLSRETKTYQIQFTPPGGSSWVTRHTGRKTMKSRTARTIKEFARRYAFWVRV